MNIHHSNDDSSAENDASSLSFRERAGGEGAACRDVRVKKALTLPLSRKEREAQATPTQKKSSFALHPYLTLMRLHQPTGIWLLLLPCLWGITLADGTPDPLLILLFTLGAIAMRGAGCVINDLWDRSFDAQVERTKARPLASGELTPRQGILFCLFLLIVGLVVLLQLNQLAILLSLMSLPLVITYPFMKRITHWPQLFLGITFNLGILIGYAAASGTLSYAAFWLYMAGIFWTLGYDTIYAHQDKTDDALIGVKSTALKLASRTKPALAIFYGITTLSLVMCGMIAGLHPLYYALIALASLHLAWQIIRVNLDAPASAMGMFKANRWTGLLILLAIILGHWPIST